MYNANYDIDVQNMETKFLTNKARITKRPMGRTTLGTTLLDKKKEHGSKNKTSDIIQEIKKIKTEFFKTHTKKKNQQMKQKVASLVSSGWQK